MKLVLATGISLSTVAKWDKGGQVSESVKLALERASAELNLNQGESDTERK